jgi:hypothetical protein
MDKFSKWSVIVGLVIAAIVIPITAPKAPRESVTMYKVTIKRPSEWMGRKRIYFNDLPKIEIIDNSFQDLTNEKDDYVTDSITITSDSGEYFYLEVSDGVSRNDPNSVFNYNIEQVTRRIKIDEKPEK